MAAIKFEKKYRAITEIIEDKNTYIIHGVNKLMNSSICEIIPDRIEAGTYMIATALIGGEVILENVNPKHLTTVVNKILETGTTVTVDKSSLIIKSPF